ncbi:hypothetical protein BASA60_000346 [Batrachochytrium salamandrivorans]|nr:hypothetical protein BASA60_000346 [Batrachochytrium salamandrivorans]
MNQWDRPVLLEIPMSTSIAVLGDSGDESGKSPKSSQKAGGSRNLFTQEAKDKSKRLFNSFRAKTKPQSFFDKDRINEPVRSSGSFGNPYEHQHSGVGDSGDESGKSPKSSQKSRGSRNLFTQEAKDKSKRLFNSFRAKTKPQSFFDKDKINEPVRSSGSFGNPYEHQHSTIDWKDVLAGSSGSFQNPYKHQHSTINWKDVLAGSSGSLEEAYKHQRRIKKIKQLNQEPLKRQDEITFRDSSNKKLTETQAQATVQPSGISQEKAVNLGPILNSLKPSQDHSHDSQTELKQANDDQQRASDEIRKRYRLKVQTTPKKRL